MNGMTPAQVERHGKLVEEMGEALQILGKIAVHGYESHHPNTPEVTNRDLLHKELGDVCAAIKLLTDSGDLSEREIYKAAAAKGSVITRYMKHQGD